jgi:hypothetical protein
MNEPEKLLRELIQFISSVFREGIRQIRLLHEECRVKAVAMICRLQAFLIWAFDVIEQYVEHWLFVILVADYLPANRELSSD